MTLREVLSKAMEIIADDEINLDANSRKRTKLIACGNMIYQELTTEYVQLKYREEIDFVNGKADYSDFTKRVKRIVSIRAGDRSFDFTMFPTCVEAKLDGKATVTYYYHPSELTLSESLDLPPQYSEYVLANGIASEFFYRSGLVDEALFYKNRYDTAVLNLSRGLTGKIMKSGGLR